MISWEKFSIKLINILEAVRTINQRIQVKKIAKNKRKIAAMILIAYLKGFSLIKMRRKVMRVKKIFHLEIPNPHALIRPLNNSKSWNLL